MTDHWNQSPTLFAGTARPTLQTQQTAIPPPPRCLCRIPAWPRQLITALRLDDAVPAIEAGRLAGLDRNRSRGDHLVARRIRKHLESCAGFRFELRELDPDTAREIDGLCERPPRADRRRGDWTTADALETSRYRHLFRE